MADLEKQTLDDRKLLEIPPPPDSTPTQIPNESHYCERLAREANFNAANMASLCSISERQLQRLFKKNLNCTPSQWLRELRCRLARQLIAQGYSSKAAAAELRFASQAHFCRVFKDVLGTP